MLQAHCAGQISGCETAVHSVRESFLQDTDAVLLVDTTNAYLLILPMHSTLYNRQSALHNIRSLCLPIATQHL